MRWAARRDAGEDQIVGALICHGASVRRLSEAGAPDLCVGYKGVTHLLEIKSGKGQLKPRQIDWRDRWRGSPVHVVRTVDEALEAIGIFK